MSLKRRKLALLGATLLLLHELGKEEEESTTASDSEEDPQPRQRLHPKPQRFAGKQKSSSTSAKNVSQVIIGSNVKQSPQHKQPAVLVTVTRKRNNPQSEESTKEEDGSNVKQIPQHTQPAVPVTVTRKRNHPQSEESNREEGGSNDEQCPQLRQPTVPVTVTRKRPHPHSEESTKEEDDETADEVVEVPMYIPPPSRFLKKKRRRRRRAAAVDSTEESATKEDKRGHKVKKPRRFWTQEMYLQRERLGNEQNPKGILHLDPTEELNLLGMSEACFQTLLTLVSPLIEKKATIMRTPISPRQRLVAVLRYLVMGYTMEALKFSTLLSPSSLQTSVIPETCQAILQVLTPKYMKFPEKKEDWQKIASEFSINCNFPNCGGSLGARHVWVNGGKATNHKNYRGYSSFILATLVDTNCTFVSAEVITDERDSDVSALCTSDFYKKLVEESLSLPENRETEGEQSFVFAGPNCYPPHERILTMYPGKYLDTPAKIAYNNRIWSANQYADNALGLVASKFAVLRVPINAPAWKVELIVRACCALHNYLSVESRSEYISDTSYDQMEDGDVLPGDWRSTADIDEHFAPLEPVTHGPSPETDHIRQQYVEYLSAKALEQDVLQIQEDCYIVVQSSN